MEEPTLRVDSILEAITPVLSERARSAFENKMSTTSPSLYYFGIVHANAKSLEEEQAAYRDFAERINDVVATFDGRAMRSADGIHHPRCDCSLAPPMKVPLMGDRYVLVAYLFVVDAPLNDEDGIKWVNLAVGNRLRCAPEGALPENPPGVATPPAPPPFEFKIPASVDEVTKPA